jgi:hypothetical protein
LRQARYGHLPAIHILLLSPAFAAALVALTQIEVSRETVRLELKAAGYVRKRAKLKGRDDDPKSATRLARIRLPIENRRPDELILFADGLDIDLLPMSVRELMLKGAQPEVRAPCKNRWKYRLSEIYDTPELHLAVDVLRIRARFE